MRVCILIASHVGSSGRASYIPETFLSIIASIALAPKNYEYHIYVSYSISDDVVNPYISDLFISNHEVQIHIYKHSRLAQFEHYLYLSQFIKCDDFVMFSDDDDLYAPDKVSTMIQSYNASSNIHVFVHDAFEFGFMISTPITYAEVISKQVEIHKYEGCIEYFQYAMCGYIFTDFYSSKYWNTSDRTSYVRGYLDIIFGVYIGNVVKKTNIVRIPHKLVYKRIHSLPRDWSKF